MSKKSVYGSHNKNIVLDKNSKNFTIELDSNPTTGYSWHIFKYDTNLFDIVDHTFFPSKRFIPGAGGRENWVFSLRNVKTIEKNQFKNIEFIYIRPWEPEKIIKRIIFTVKIN